MNKLNISNAELGIAIINKYYIYKQSKTDQRRVGCCLGFRHFF